MLNIRALELFTRILADFKTFTEPKKDLTVNGKIKTKRRSNP